MKPRWQACNVALVPLYNPVFLIRREGGGLEASFHPLESEDHRGSQGHICVQVFLELDYTYPIPMLSRSLLFLFVS